MRNLSVAFTLLSLSLQIAYACNVFTCAPIVSKCMITESCNCEFSDCSCCRECFDCLSYLFSECCDCVGMCPLENTTIPKFSTKSHVENLEGVPGLFSALTGMNDDGWKSFTFPVVLDGVFVSTNVKSHTGAARRNTNDRKTQSTDYNCTVVFMAQCLSWNKCKHICLNMGASSYRWFHDGCCECVGSSCLNYGINESQCSQCSWFYEDFESGNSDQSAEFDEDDYSMGELDYGDYIGPMDDLHAEL